MVQELDLDPKGLAALIAFPAEKWWVKMAGVQRFFSRKMVVFMVSSQKNHGRYGRFQCPIDL